MVLAPSCEPLRIGTATLPGRALLAPMSGVSDLPFRRMATQFGAPAVVSEMVACEAVARGSEEVRLRAEGEGLPIHIVQLCGREPEAMAEGVKVAEASGAHVIDINMGCPARLVTTGYAGAALMRDLDHAERIIEATLAAASVPVTLKMRLGWDDTMRNAPELAARAERAGIAMVTVHGRTRCQFYNGQADWAAIREVRDAVTIPLVANGDLVDPGDAPAMLETSGADAVMIGRGSYGRPWIVGQTAALLAGQAPAPKPERDDLVDLVLAHHELMLGHYGREKGMRIARKHLGWYMDATPGVAPALRAAILRETDLAAIRRSIRTAFAEPEALAA